MIPWQLKAGLQALRSGPRRRAQKERWAALQPAPASDPITVSFGGTLTARKSIHGGAVKLLALREGFAWNEERFNQLYLVSSVLPEFVEDLVDAARARGIPFVWNQNGVGYPGWAGNEAEMHNRPLRRLRANADYVIYQSDFCRESATKFLGPTTVPGEVLWNPVDLRVFQPPMEPLPETPLRLLTLGTHTYPDRVLNALRCLKELRRGGVESTLTVAGPFTWRGGATEVQREIERLELTNVVRLLPPFKPHEAAELYRTHHVVLHPKYLDPCPTVVIESLACGVPVIGSASGGLPELIPASCGELIPAPVRWDRLITPTGEELAAAVDRLRPRLALASASARRHAEAHFDERRWVERHREIFAKLRQ